MAAQNGFEGSRRTALANHRRVVDFAAQGISDVLALGRYEYHAVQPGLKPHSHPGAVEICYLERGCQTYRVEGVAQRLVGGEVLVVPAGVLHDTAELPEDCGVLYWLILRLPEGSSRLLELTPEDSAALCGRLRALPRSKFVGRPALRSTLQQLFVLHGAEDGPMARLLVRHELVTCLLEVLRCAEAGQGRALSAAIRRTAERIEARPHEAFSLRGLAKGAGLSLSRFKVKFKDEMGIAPREFILRVKVESAKRALAQDGASVTEIAVGLGFSSSQYFATVFKRFTQMTPGAFRRRCGAVAVDA